jgi:GAF domain-containing protein
MKLMKAPIPANEADRLAALRQYEILDTAPEQAFDDIVKIASFICGTPIATVTLVDADRQWFKARTGVTHLENPREHSFCAHTILQSETLVVEDATLDVRFADNPLVTAANGIRFYAGTPLINAEGFGLGSLCVIDNKSRLLEAHQQTTLEALARMVVANLELRRVSSELAAQLENVKTLGGLLPICGHCKNIRNDRGYWEKIEFFVQNHSTAIFSHGLCPDCSRIYFPGIVPAEISGSGKK